MFLNKFFSKDNVFFTSDTHFSHTNIIKYCNRPFGNSREMDESLIDSFNKTLNKNSVLFHLGDFGFFPKDRKENCLKEILSKINCKNIYLIWGNHDSRFYNNYFLGNYDILEINVDNINITLCHYAMCFWNKSHHGAYHFYGHAHGTMEDQLNSLFPERNSLDVGVDNAYKLLGEFRPFSFNEIEELLKRKL